MKKSNRKMRKALLVTCCALALVAISVGATLAYLTDNESVTNTFTVGRVGISLDEAPVNTAGQEIDGARRQNNEYHLIPGQTYTKDPKVTLDANSESSYIRMLVTVEDYNDLLHVCETVHFNEKDSHGNFYHHNGIVLLQNFTDWTEDSKWEYEGVTTDPVANTATYEFRYEEPVGNPNNTALPLEPLFNEFTLPGWMNNEDLLKLDELEINVVAHAVQAAGFEDDEDAAWAAFNAQMGTN